MLVATMSFAEKEIKFRKFGLTSEWTILIFLWKWTLSHDVFVHLYFWRQEGVLFVLLLIIVFLIPPWKACPDIRRQSGFALADVIVTWSHLNDDDDDWDYLISSFYHKG